MNAFVPIINRYAKAPRYGVLKEEKKKDSKPVTQ